MNIVDIDTATQAYYDLEKKIKAIAVAKLGKKLSGQKDMRKSGEHVAKSYARMESFYVENGVVRVDFTYAGPYSGQDHVLLYASDVEAI